MQETSTTYDPELVDYDAQLSALSGQDLEQAIATVETKDKIKRCLSTSAPMGLVAKFADRADEVKDELSILARARVLQAQKRFDEAKVLYESPELQNDSTALCNLGLIFAEEDNKEEAIGYYERSAELGNPIAHYNLGYYSAQEGNIDQAIDHLEQALAKGGDKLPDLKIKFFLGNLYAQRGEMDKAKKLLGEAGHDIPDDARLLAGRSDGGKYTTVSRG